MIIQAILDLLISFIGFLTGWLPNSGDAVLKLPWGIDDLMVQGVNGYKILAEAFPPFNVVLSAFIIYLGFRIAMKILRMVPLFGKSID